jgi:hypothetical protein
MVSKGVLSGLAAVALGIWAGVAYERFNPSQYDGAAIRIMGPETSEKLHRDVTKNDVSPLTAILGVDSGVYRTTSNSGSYQVVYVAGPSPNGTNDSISQIRVCAPSCDSPKKPPTVKTLPEGVGFISDRSPVLRNLVPGEHSYEVQVRFDSGYIATDTAKVFVK